MWNKDLVIQKCIDALQIQVLPYAQPMLLSAGLTEIDMVTPGIARRVQRIGSVTQQL